MILGEIIAAIATALLHMVVGLLSLVFSSAYLATHQKGAIRVFAILSSLSALHLILGLIVPFLGAYDIVILSWIFNKWAMLGSLIVLIFSLAANTAMGKPAPMTGPVLSEGPFTSEPDHPTFFILGLIVVLLVGFGSIFSAQEKRKTLRERMCDDVSGRISQEWKDRGAAALSWSERLVKREFGDKIPCVDKDR